MAIANYFEVTKVTSIRGRSDTFPVSAKDISLDPKYEDSLILELGSDRTISASFDKAHQFATSNDDEPFSDMKTAEKEFRKVQRAVAKGNYQLEFNPLSGYKLKLKPANRRKK